MNIRNVVMGLALALGAAVSAFAGPYTWLEYVQSTGKQYVDTGLIGRSGISSEIDMSWDSTGQVIVMGSTGTNSVTNKKQLFAVYGNDITGYNGLLYAYGSGYRGTGWTYTRTKARYTVTSRLFAGDQRVTAVDQETGTVLYDKVGTVADECDTELNMYLFGWNDDGEAKKLSSICIYAMDVFQDDVLVRRFRPAKRKADGAVGLYDVVNDAFYESESGTALLAGPEVIRDTITVVGSPAGVGDPRPTFGDLTCTIGETYEFSVDRTWTNAEGTASAVCTGWRYKLDDGTTTEGSTLSKSIAYDETTRESVLTWFFEPQYRLTVNATARGKVSDDWYAHGTRVSVPVPEPASAMYRFDHWEGTGVTEANRTDDPLVVEMNAPVALTACFKGDYTWLEYVESTGAQYFDTGLPGRNDLSVKMRISQFTSSGYTLGAAKEGQWGNEYVVPFAMMSQGSTGIYIANYVRLSWNTPPTYLCDIDATLTKGRQEVTLTKVADGTVWNTASTSDTRNFDTGYNLYAFALNNNGTAAGFAKMRCHSMVIVQDGEVVRSFRPAKRNADGEPGLYDTVNGKFYPSESGTSLVAGPELAGAYLTVTGSPAEYGRSNPVYGETAHNYGDVAISLSADQYEDGVSAVALGEGYRVPVTGCSISADGAAATFYPSTAFDYTLPLLSQEISAQWVFASEQYRVIARAAAHGKVSVNGGAAAVCVTNWVDVGSEVTITAIPDSEANEFIGWTGLTATEPQAQVTVSGPIDCTASFTSGGKASQWKGGGDGRWSTASNWSGGVLPAEGGAVSIAGGVTVTVDCQTPELASLTVSGEGTTLVFDDGALAAPDALVAEVRAADVQILEGAVVTHARNTMQVADYLASGEWKMNARVHISCSNLTVDADSAIDVDGKGFYQTDTSNDEYGGPGPGGGNVNAKTARGAAGHGGYGSGTHLHDVAEPYVAGMPYGSFRTPVWCGSAGDRGSDVSKLGFPGGGAVRIAATGTVTVDGRISANSVAVDGTDGSRYGGSGGSIWISSKTVVGSGTLSADGGLGSSTGSSNAYTGGGGRIAVEYDPAEMDKLGSLPALVFSVDTPSIVRPTSGVQTTLSSGDVGTLYFTDTRFLGTTFSSSITGVRNGEIHAGSWAGWAPASLAVTGVRVRFVEEGALNVTIPGDVVVSGFNAKLYFGGDENYAWSKYGGIVKHSTYAPRVTLGTLTLKTGGDCCVCPAATNGVAATDRQAQLTVTGSLALTGTDNWSDGSTALVCDCHPTNGASVKIVCGSCEVKTASVISSKGYGTDGTRGATAYGLGPGASSIGGAGYGGVGAARTPGPGGRTYGDAAWPLLPGSSADGSGPGGGVVWMEVEGELKNNGTISADATATGTGAYDKRAASGGSVCITCRTLAGSGKISVVSPQVSLQSGKDVNCSGGGGRIAIRYDAAAQAALETPSSVKIDARGGFTWYWADNPQFENADMGTVWLTDGTLLGNRLSTAGGVQMGEIHLGDWSTWRPSPLTLDGVRVRLAPGTAALELPGDVVISNAARLGFGGGAYALSNSVARLPYTKGVGPKVKIAGDVTLLRGTTSGASANGNFKTEFELLAGDPTGTDAAIGGELEIGGKLTVATNCFVRFTSHPLTGASGLLKVRELQLDEGGTIDAKGRGFSGTTGFAGPTGIGPGAGSAEAASGAHGGNGGAPTEETVGLAYDERKSPVLPGSGGVGRTTNINQWDYSKTSPAGAGGGVIRIECKETMSLAGTVTAEGGDGTDILYGNGAGAGGSVFLCCKTWNPSETLAISANGGDHSGRDGYGGGGGRIAIRRRIDNDPTPTAERTYVSAAAGGSNGRASVLPTDGTVYWGRWNNGMMVIVR